VPDVNGDTFDDVLIGTSRVDDLGSSNGGAYLLLGPALGTLSTASGRYLGDGQWGDSSGGVVVNGAGDVNGDGYNDIVLGASSTWHGRGSAHVVFGQDFF